MLCSRAGPGAQPPQRWTQQPRVIPAPGRMLILESPAPSDHSEPGESATTASQDLNTPQFAEPLFEDTYLIPDEDISPYTSDLASPAQWSFDKMPHIWITPVPDEEDEYASDYSDNGYDSLPEDTTIAQTLSYVRHGKPQIVEISRCTPATSPIERAPPSMSRNSSISTTYDTIFTGDSPSKPSTAASSISEQHNVSPKIPSRIYSRSADHDFEMPGIDLKPFRKGHQQRTKTSLHKIEELTGRSDIYSSSWLDMGSDEQDKKRPSVRVTEFAPKLASSPSPQGLRRSRKSVASLFTKR